MITGQQWSANLWLVCMNCEQPTALFQWPGILEGEGIIMITREFWDNLQLEIFFLRTTGLYVLHFVHYLDDCCIGFIPLEELPSLLSLVTDLTW